ncbi:hypothetical protein [Marinobacter sp. CHS3-4]|uniref:hypothetical protein n=1 Tax=Marinobacter sp. CHS3-4 TaxID=3045174 RepID=UPI0024B4B9BF|nr:hypothetical protein [Marinobacter sp. CHS3-4]MDI9244719.1 hypothetical protein [Marinobacter sp. CHS3-4]
MKFPIATVALVSAALAFVFWQYNQAPPAGSEENRFHNLSSNPIERGEVVDWVASQVSDLCVEATGFPSGTEKHGDCVASSESNQPGCRRLAAAEYPPEITSDAAFRDLSTTMMACMVRQSRPLNG